jgi:hypothetical protein
VTRHCLDPFPYPLGCVPYSLSGLRDSAILVGLFRLLLVEQMFRIGNRTRRKRAQVRQQVGDPREARKRTDSELRPRDEMRRGGCRGRPEGLLFKEGRTLPSSHLPDFRLPSRKSKEQQRRASCRKHFSYSSRSIDPAGSTGKRKEDDNREAG